MKTAILGAGLTGITLARMLNEKGEDITVLEKEKVTGGLCRSKTGEGFTFDIGGSHIIFSRDTEVNDFMCDVLGDNKNKRNRNTKIFFKGAYVKYPFENGLYQLPPEDRFFCINEFVKNLIALEKGELKDPENFKEWIYHTFGKGIAESYMVPYNEKIWNYPTEKMSHHWVDGRIPRPPVEDIIKSAIGIETEGYTHQSVFTYPVTGGIEALVHAIAEPVKDKIRTGFEIKSIKKTQDGFIISNGSEEVACESCISTIPVQALIRCLDDVPDKVKNAVSALKFNSIACVGIGVKGKMNDISWLYIPQKELGRFNRISFPSNYSTEVAPKGCSSVLAEVTFNDGDEVSKMTDGEIAEHCIDGLCQMGIIPSKDMIVYTTVERFEYAYVVYDIDYLKNIKTVTDYFSTSGIDLVGRFSEFEYINMDGCIRHVIDYVKNKYTAE
ncbi:MAG: FAD-dependent oxidoreductase [Methanomicrobiaceae archaeon]|nr:FAD-dependent oxidoreductase [Methanomicrobiaceae archaeon]